MNNLLRKLFSASRNPAKPRTQIGRRLAPVLESLPKLELLTGSYLSFMNETIQIGNPGNSNPDSSIKAVVTIDHHGTWGPLDDTYELDLTVVDTFIGGPNAGPQHIHDSEPAQVTKQIKFFGMNGNDSLDASTISIPVVAQGYGGNDVLTGGYANDTLIGGDGNDSLSGGYGNDLITGGYGSDVVHGNEGDDIVSGQNNGFIPSGGNPYILDYDFVFGDDGNDTMYGGYAVTFMYGGNGNDAISGGGGASYMYGDNGNDAMLGGYGNDVLHGGNGNDLLNGNNGNDQLFGDDGKDTLYGGLGDDLLDGGNDAYVDILYGDDPNFIVAGNDTFVQHVQVGGFIPEAIMDFNYFGKTDKVKV